MQAGEDAGASRQPSRSWLTHWLCSLTSHSALLEDWFASWAPDCYISNSDWISKTNIFFFFFKAYAHTLNHCFQKRVLSLEETPTPATISKQQTESNSPVFTFWAEPRRWWGKTGWEHATWTVSTGTRRMSPNPIMISGNWADPSCLQSLKPGRVGLAPSCPEAAKAKVPLTRCARGGFSTLDSGMGPSCQCLKGRLILS